jgi:hypothetical protein
MEETWQAVFRNLYTGFLLRDFAGKIVPGVFLLFSIAALFRSPAALIRELRKDVPLFGIVFLAGFAWTVTLGTQSLAEGLRIWKYFPVAGQTQPDPSPQIGFWLDLYQGGNESNFDAGTAKVDLFQVGANEDEKQQYERFVVIKEACGNLFIAGLLSLPAWLVVIVRREKTDSEGNRAESNKRDSRRARHNSTDWLRTAGVPTLASLYFILIMIGLHRMNAQHVRRQLRYAEIVAENRKNQSQRSMATTPKPPAPKEAPAATLPEVK